MIKPTYSKEAKSNQTSCEKQTKHENQHRLTNTIPLDDIDFTNISNKR